MGKTTWRDENYVRAYRFASEGLSRRKIAKALGVSIHTFTDWYKAKPALRDAIAQARRPNGDTLSFQDYVYKRLPRRLKKVWDRINKAGNSKSAQERVEALLEGTGRTARQHLFLYALPACNFNPSEACRKLNIHRAQLDSWMRTDPDFTDLVEEMQWHKKNFFEEALVDLVRERDTSAVLFANRTQNKDRGYDDTKKLDLNVAGSVTVEHNLVPLHKLDFDTRRLLLEKIEEVEAEDAEYEIKKEVE